MTLTEEQKKINQDILLDLLELPKGDLPKFEGNTPYGEFHTSWEWIMPCVHAINTLIAGDNDESKRMQEYLNCNFNYLIYRTGDTYAASSNVIDIYNECLDFCNWYNEEYGIIGDVRKFMSDHSKFEVAGTMGLGFWNTGEIDLLKVKPIKLRNPLYGQDSIGVSVLMDAGDFKSVAIRVLMDFPNKERQTVFYGYIEEISELKTVFHSLGIGEDK